MSEDRYLKKILIHKFRGSDKQEVEDITILESRLSLFLNDEKAISMMCIPKDQDAHAVGFLMSENIINNIDDISEIKVSEDGLRVDIKADINEESLLNLYKEKTLTSGCGGGVTGNIANEDGNTVHIAFNKTKFSIKPELLYEEVRKFYRDSELYRLTGCVHKAMLYLEDTKTITSEDIGRHNAIDKVVGKCKLKRLDTKKAILFVSGRLSSEMVTKAVMHKIAFVVSRTAPTYLGVKVAHDHGITLVGFARGKRMNVYTYSGRIDES